MTRPVRVTTLNREAVKRLLLETRDLDLPDARWVPSDGAGVGDTAIVALRVGTQEGEDEDHVEPLEELRRWRRGAMAVGVGSLENVVRADHGPLVKRVTLVRGDTEIEYDVSDRNLPQIAE